jgi:hypothetical protein
MSIGKSKKIAFIGCSHLSATEVECQGKNNWTYQLYQKYPHHQYRNYSGGGKGIEHFQLALLDAKKWGADVVFMNRTYCGRWLMMAELSPIDPIGFQFEVFNNEDNWEELHLQSQALWGNVRQLTANVSENNMYSWIKKLYNTVEILFKDHMAASETRRQYEWEWYSNVTKLYNFEHIFLIDWAQSSHTKIPAETNEDHLISSNVNDLAVVEWFCKKYNATGESIGERPLYSFKVTISKDDNHLTHYGNNVLLEQYILANKNVTKALT